ncbi:MULTISPECIES: hypothetical protein [Pseudomonas]|nr:MULTISPECIES: hypothetical protein [Pseudomonas]
MMVITGNYPAAQSIFADPLELYPVVRKEGEELYVGLMAGGDIRPPVVTADIWIDQNEVWMISSQETPISLTLPSMELLLGLSPDVTEQARTQGLDVLKVMGGNVLARGDKAKAILKQMLAGRVLKYRTVDIKRATSPTREVILDESFSHSLQMIGVDQRSL